MALRKFRYSRNETGGARPAANAPPEPMVRRRSTSLAACPYPYPCPFPWVCPVVSAAVAADAQAAAADAPPAARAAVVAAPPAAVDAQAAAAALPAAAAAVVAAPPAAVDAQAAAAAPAAHLQAARWPAACPAGCCRGAPKLGDRSADCLAGRCWPQVQQVDYSPPDGLAARFLAALRSAEGYSAYCSAGHSAEHCPLRDPDARCFAADPAGCPHRSAVVPAALRAASSRVPPRFSAGCGVGVPARRRAAGLHFAGWRPAAFPGRVVGAVAQSLPLRRGFQSARVDAPTLAALLQQTPAALAPLQEP